MDKSKVPQFVSHVTKTLQGAGFEAYLVGGCVRDMIIANSSHPPTGGVGPKDWDLTTNARPEQVQDVFKDLKNVYENTYGTVTVLNMRPVSQETVPRETKCP